MKIKSSDGFSPFICLILLVANIVRVFWWFAEEFNMILLVASLVMIACQMILLYLWVTIKQENTREEKIMRQKRRLDSGTALSTENNDEDQL